MISEEFIKRYYYISKYLILYIYINNTLKLYFPNEDFLKLFNISKLIYVFQQAIIRIQLINHQYIKERGDL